MHAHEYNVFKRWHSEHIRNRHFFTMVLMKMHQIMRWCIYICAYIWRYVSLYFCKYRHNGLSSKFLRLVRNPFTHALTHKSKHTHIDRGSLSLMSLSLALCLNLAKSVRAPQSFQIGFQNFKTFTRPVPISKYYGTNKICPHFNTRTSPQIYTPSIFFSLQHFPARMLRRSQG